MKKSILVGGVISLVALSVLVYAAVLVDEKQVSSCFDSDGGLVFNVTGRASGVSLDGTNYTRTDFCVGSDIIHEFACRTNGTQVYVQEWKEQCNLLNPNWTCVSGRCQ